MTDPQPHPTASPRLDLDPARWARQMAAEGAEGLQFFRDALVESYDPILGLGYVLPDVWYRLGLDLGDRIGAGDKGSDEVFVEKLEALCREARARDIQRLMLCDWGGDGLDEATFADSDALAILATHARAFPNLRSLYIGEEPTYQGEPESFVGPVGRVLRAFPRLQHLEVRAQWMAWGAVSHDHLTQLVLDGHESPDELLDALAGSHLPALAHLDLWLGGDGYGPSAPWDELLASLLSAKLFPGLRSLHLRGIEDAHQVRKLVETSPLGERLHDLTVG